MVREKMPAAHPVSECKVTAEGVTLASTGAKATLLGVASPKWERDDFVQVKAWRFMNAFNAVSWTYTLDLQGKTWRIGVVKADRIADANSESALRATRWRAVLPGA
jgi:hypothetical protein